MKLTKEQIKDIPNLLKDNTIAQIAASYHIHPRTVLYWIKRLRNDGIEVATKPGRKPIRLNDK